METIHRATASSQYGPLQANFTYDLRSGYTALVGPNNAGKSAILQLVFRSLVDEAAGPGGVALILPDRDYITPTTETGGRQLNAWNAELRQTLANGPLIHGQDPVGPRRSELARLLMHGNLIRQYQEMNELLERLALPQFELRAAQNVFFEEIIVHLQGSGVRGLLPILAALTNPDVRFVLIDEPELSLEPRIQRALRDVLIEKAEERIIVVATHSHLFVRREVVDANQIVERSAPNETSVRTLTDRRELYDLVFDLLGSSTEDLFFPSNYLIVEGASDQVIVEKVLELLKVPSPRIKVLAARGVDAVRDAVESVYRASVPLIVNDSPYAGRVVALIDQPNNPDAPNLKRLKKDLGNRLYVLDRPSMEEYIPEPIYARATRNKDEDLAELERLHGDRAARERLKGEIATSLAAELTEEDFDSIKMIVDAAKRAIDEST